MSLGVIVAGLGAMGSAACYHLARRGARVAGFDAFERGHHRGSSHGRSRIIRQAYFESPHYVALVQRAFELWRSLETEVRRPLLNPSGGLWIGHPESDVVAGALESARLHGLRHELLDAKEIQTRYPMFRLPPEMVGMFEPEAGILDPEACVESHVDRARDFGAVLAHDEPVESWTSTRSAVAVTTRRSIYHADALVLSPGAWSSALTQDLSLPLEVERVFVAHFEPDDPDRFAISRCPLYMWEIPEGIYYGFPALPGQGMKFGQHGSGELTAPDSVRAVTTEEVESLRTVLNRFLPGAGGRSLSAPTCLYVNTPDRHFILDRHPAHSNVFLAAGFCGHGFKFASVVGEILADLALQGETRHPIGFLSVNRPALARR